MTVAYVGIGANLDRPEARVRDAFEALGALPATRLLRRSSLYRTAPQGSAGQPDFVNAVAAIDSALPPAQLLAALREVETHEGRVRSVRNAPRTLDLDLLLYGDQRIDQPGLAVPHPRMHQRAFVLVPLLEIAPEACIPGIGPAAACLAGVAGQPVTRMA